MQRSAPLRARRFNSGEPLVSSKGSRIRSLRRHTSVPILDAFANGVRAESRGLRTCRWRPLASKLASPKSFVFRHDARQ